MFPKLVTISIPDFLQGILPAYISLYSFGMLVVLGIVAGLVVTVVKAKKLGMSLDKVMNLYMWLILAAVAGSKFFFYLEDFETYLHEPTLIFPRIAGGGCFTEHLFSLWVLAFGGCERRIYPINQFWTSRHFQFLWSIFLGGWVVFLQDVVTGKSVHLLLASRLLIQKPLPCHKMSHCFQPNYLI
jgi:uncharacterized membrane protein